MFPAERLALAERYAALLASEGVLRGLIGPRETPRLWDRHLFNSVVLEEQLPAGAEVADIGSGAGLPGIVVAIARPDLRVTLVEPLLRRTTFLEEVVSELGLDVRVVRGRAEELHGGDGFDVVTSRAVAPLARLLAWSMPLVRPRGALVALKGSSVASEIEDAAPAVRAWRAAPPKVLELGAGRGGEPTWAVRVAWADPSSVSWPPSRSSSPRSERPRSGRPRSGNPRSGRPRGEQRGRRGADQRQRPPGSDA